MVPWEEMNTTSVNYSYNVLSGWYEIVAYNEGRELIQFE
jgi:hypothetical protein